MTAKAHPSNTVHFACFDCRSAFKQRESSNWIRLFLNVLSIVQTAKHQWVSLGRYFKAPPKRAIKQWFKVELLYAFGERFSSSYSSLGQSCDTLSATIAYLIDIGNDASDVRLRLKHIQTIRRSE